MMNKKSTLFVIVGALVLVAGFALFQNNQKEKDAINSPVALVPVEKVAIKNEAVTMNNYKNTKYNYSLEYPSNYFIYQNVTYGEGPVAQKITEKGDGVFIAQDKDSIDFIFDISGLGFSVLNASTIKDQFGVTKPGEIDVVAITIGGQSGYKVKFNKEDSSRVSDFYFVKTSSGQVLEVTVLKNNEVAEQIFSSLNFVK